MLYCAEQLLHARLRGSESGIGFHSRRHGPRRKPFKRRTTPMVLAIKACGHDFLPRLFALGECCRPAAVSHSAGDLTTAAVSKLHQTSHLA